MTGAQLKELIPRDTRAGLIDAAVYAKPGAALDLTGLFGALGEEPAAGTPDFGG